LYAVTSKNTEGITEIIQPFFGGGITAISKKAVSLKQACRTDKFIGIPPEGWATG
jgi:hypothetical protein